MRKENEDFRNQRRTFIKSSAAAAVGLTILPSYVVGGLGHKAPSDKLNIAGIGVGNMGGGNLDRVSSENIVAICDVDWNYAQHVFNRYPKAKKYYDFRKMYDEMGKDIDAVVVATPDHTHAIIAIEAMKRGMHAYVQKPLSLTVWESRKMAEVANKYNVVTQMGNQGNSGEGIRQVCEWIWDGAIGEVKEVHAWTNRPFPWWPQPQKMPTEKMKVPDKLEWDLFIGGAEYYDYNRLYHPHDWRGWWNFGTGALGDMANHIMDPIFKALKLKYPTKVEAVSTEFNAVSPPAGEIIHYTFPPRSNMPKVDMPEVKVHWYDGLLQPQRPPELPEGEIMGRDEDGGTLFIGSKGKLMTGCYANHPFLLPLDYDRAYKRPDKTLRRVENGVGGHEMDWVRACKESPENRTLPSSNFNYSGPLNEMVVMGVVACRLQGLNRELHWDGANMRFTNISDDDEMRVVHNYVLKEVRGAPQLRPNFTTINAKKAAEAYINRPYRKGWEIDI